MSLTSNDGGSKNPAKKFFSWKGGIGVWEYYDKDKQEKVQISDTMYIVPLDELSTIKGWHDGSQSGIYSNEVKNLNEEELSVKSFKGGELTKGLYSSIKGNLQGGKFCKSVYAAILDSKGNVIEMVNFSFSGSSLGSWIEAEIKIKEGKILTISKNPEQQKKGATTYYVPKIVKSDKRDAIMAECEGLDRELQEYLGGHKNEQPKAASTPNKEFEKQAAAPVAESSDLPF